MRKRHLDSIAYDPISVSRLEPPFIPLHKRGKAQPPIWGKSVRILGEIPEDLNNIRFVQWMREKNGTLFSRGEGISGFEGIMNVKKKKEEPVHFPVCGFPTERSGMLLVYNRYDKATFAWMDFDVQGRPWIRESQTADELGITNFSAKVYCHAKRFTHRIPMVSGATVEQELYFVAMSLNLVPSSYYPGWTGFCERYPTHPLLTNTGSKRVLATVSLLKNLQRINAYVNNVHDYFPDGALDNWEILGEGQSGDCEDFALTKADILLNVLKLPASSIHLMAGVTEDSLGHAWLVVQTTMGDYAMDVTKDALVCNRALPYTMQMRQTGTVWKLMNVLDGFKVASHAGYDSTYNEPYVWWYIFNPDTSIFTKLYSEPYHLPYNTARRMTTYFTLETGNPVAGGLIATPVNENKYFNRNQDLEGANPPYGAYGVPVEMFNTSADNTKFYASRGPYRYSQGKLAESAVARGFFLVTSAGSAWAWLSGDRQPLFIDRDGWFYFTTRFKTNVQTHYQIYRASSADGITTEYEAGEYNILSWSDPSDTEIECLSFDSLVISSPDGYYDWQYKWNDGSYSHQTTWLVPSEWTITESAENVFDTALAGSYEYKRISRRWEVVGDEYRSHDIAAAMTVVSQMPGMFAKDFTQNWWDHLSVTHELHVETRHPYHPFYGPDPTYTTAYLGTTEHIYTLNIPTGEISCGDQTDVVSSDTEYFASSLPDRRWPVAWFHIQGIEGSPYLQAFMLSAPAAAWSTSLGVSTTRIYKDGVSVEDVIANAVGVESEKILGMIYVPKKEAA